jgi:dihydromethanopterin reductase
MIRAIVAMGERGQIGLNGGLPWHFSDDLAHFKQRTTEGGILIAGYHTMQSLPNLPGRFVLLDDVNQPVPRLIRYWGPDLWIIGGAKTYRRWAPWIRQWDISRVHYNGPADAYFDPAWLLMNKEAV